MGLRELVSCSTCGAKMKVVDGRCKCKYCGSEYEYVEEERLDDRRDNMLAIAGDYMMRGKFDDAAEEYRLIIKDYPEEPRAYWGAFLSEYGIEFLIEGGKRTPICHRISRLSAMDSRDLKKLLSICSPAQKENYYSQAEEIERIRSAAYATSRRQENYEIFICHGKGLDEKSIADELCDKFESLGRKVFMPSRNIREGERNAEIFVYPAIESCRYMFVVANSLGTLGDTDSAWRRFIKDKSKKIQVIHGGLNEQDFPTELRLTFQLREPILSSDSKWLENAVEFASESKREAEAPAAPQVDKAYIDSLVGRLSSGGIYGQRANNLTEAFIMVLSCLAAGNDYEGERAINEQLGMFSPPAEVRAVAELCLNLTRLPKIAERDRRGCMMNVSNIAAQIKGGNPTLTLAERSLYSGVSNAKLLVYLAKCFGAMKDYGRQCFVLDMIDYGQLYDTRIINELIEMQLKVGRYDDVRNVLRSVPRMDGDYVLMAVLKNFDGDKMQSLLLDIADRMSCTDAIESELNYWLATCDDIDIAVTVVSIMKKNGLNLASMSLNGALSRVSDVSGVKTVLEAIGSRPLLGAEVDALVNIGANGGAAIANEVLTYLYTVSRISELGTYNMSLLIEKCGLPKIKNNLFRFNIDKKLGEQLLKDALKSNAIDRLSNVQVLVDTVPSVDIAAYERLLLSDDPVKTELMKLLAPKTGKFASYNSAIEKYLSSSADDDEKREIYALYGDFPFSERARELYLKILPREYDEKYMEELKIFLEGAPAKSREMFVLTYEKLIKGYERALPIILSYVRSMPEEGVIRFVCDFRGDQSLKNTLFKYLLRFIAKPKAVEASSQNLNCNLAQAYLLNMTSPDGVAEIIEILRKNGVKADEKVIYSGKKFKFGDYLNMCGLSSATVADIQRIIK